MVRTPWSANTTNVLKLCPTILLLHDSDCICSKQILMELRVIFQIYLQNIIRIAKEITLIENSPICFSNFPFCAFSGSFGTSLVKCSPSALLLRLSSISHFGMSHNCNKFIWGSLWLLSPQPFIFFSRKPTASFR